MIHAVIMAGGSGTRFWPESRRARPKQLLKIAGDRTMIRSTVERILPLAPFERIMVVTNAFHAEEVRDQLPELTPEMIVAEPEARNTAPCIALAAYKLFQKDPDGVMLVLPADHVIGKEEQFREALRIAVEAAAKGDHLITFGIVPNRPETGYGYVQLGAPVFQAGSAKVYNVARFIEKPNRAKAEEYVATGEHMWNSGMFVWKISAIIKAFQEHLPLVSQSMERIAPVLNTPNECDAVAEAYAHMAAISIDHGIMEKAKNVLTIPIDVDWNDVGSWASLHDVWDRDEQGNATRGHVLALDSNGCIGSSPYKLAALIGVDDLIVIDTPDALLVCKKDKAQDVRRLQEMLRDRGYEKLL